MTEKLYLTTCAMVSNRHSYESAYEWGAEEIKKYPRAGELTDHMEEK